MIRTLPLLLVALAAPLAAQTMPEPTSTPSTTAVATPAPAAVAAVDDKQICKRATKSGSRIQVGKKECHTKAEWDEINAENRRRAAE